MTASVEDWIAYAAARGDAVADDADSAAALVRAQDHYTYALLPRLSAAPPDAIADAAVYELAKLELATPGFWSKTFTPDQQKTLTKVGDVQWTVRGDASGAMGAMPVSTKVEAMLAPYMRIVGIGAWAV
ncbi:hypothetical protein [Pseudooceanicola atlanticus]|uniref:Uncharacterized protein n=1 Tax=Pseudooceanicola atlanticus TaxID=1461694 RepID=A0A0A0EN65_9RHOB|nr:hypothetical protein [Pseudooceanicola atlanticus]KGM50657.1 hypothetical protein ATO9_04070 [Pseudooceanicola atlanticus]